MKNKKDTLLIKEIYCSLQGEGARMGAASIFIRLAGCNLACWFCDTKWSNGIIMSIKEIQKKISKFSCNTIVWTGGEPTLQLTNDILQHFPTYYHCIETNGTNPVPSLINYIACSPKKDVSVQILHKNFPNGVNEFRYPVDIFAIDLIPKIDELPNARHYYLSPVFLGKDKKQICKHTINMCVLYIKNSPKWKLSIQLHKLIDIR